jgi:hypothetical protein
MKSKKILSVLLLTAFIFGCQSFKEPLEEAGKTTVASPVFSLSEGSYKEDISVGLSSSTEGSSIYYTVDGSAPTTQSTRYTGAIPVAGHNTVKTIKAIAVKEGFNDSGVVSGTYSIQYNQAKAPAFSMLSGTYSQDVSISLSTDTAEAKIYYTLDGSAPDANATLYEQPIAISGQGTQKTVKAIAVQEGMNPSSVINHTYTINYNQVSTVIFSLAGGSYSSDITVSLSNFTQGADIYYTLNGSTPTESSTQYTAPISISGEGTEVTVKAIGIKSGMSPSAVGTQTYKITSAPLEAPRFTPSGGNYTTNQTINISSPTPGATIYYTMDGSTPTTSSLSLGGGGNIDLLVEDGLLHTYTIKAIAVKSGKTDSTVVTQTFNIKRDFGYYTYYSTYTQDSHSALGFVQTTRDPGGTALDEQAKQTVFANIRHKAIPGSIEYIKVIDVRKDINSESSFNSFKIDVNNALNAFNGDYGVKNVYYQNPDNSQDKMMELTEYIQTGNVYIDTALAIFRFIYNVFGSGNPTYHGRAVGYIAKYKTNLNTLTSIGLGFKDVLTTRIPVKPSGQEIYDLKWHPVNWGVEANQGIWVYVKDDIKYNQNTPVYEWDISSFETAEAIDVVKKTIGYDGSITIGIIDVGVMNIVEKTGDNDKAGQFPYLLSFYNDYPLHNYTNAIGGCAFSCPQYVYEAHSIASDPTNNITINHEIGRKIQEMKNSIYEALPPNVMLSTVVFHDLSQILEIGQPSGSTQWYEKKNDENYIGVTGKIAFKYTYDIYEGTREVWTEVGDRNTLKGQIEAIPNAPNVVRQVQFLRYTGDSFIPVTYVWQNGTLYPINN